jgi:hypothetical protein
VLNMRDPSAGLMRGRWKISRSAVTPSFWYSDATCGRWGACVGECLVPIEDPGSDERGVVINHGCWRGMHPVVQQLEELLYLVVHAVGAGEADQAGEVGHHVGAVLVEVSVLGR